VSPQPRQQRKRRLPRHVGGREIVRIHPSCAPARNPLRIESLIRSRHQSGGNTARSPVAVAPSGQLFHAGCDARFDSSRVSAVLVDSALRRMA
jgi:hypothetical protein